MKHWFIFLTFLIVSMYTSIAIADEVIADPWNIKLAVYSDGKRSKQSMIVEVTVRKTTDGYNVTWDMVNILTQDGKVILRPIHWSSDNGMIKNIQVHTPDAISFDIPTVTRTLKVVCTKNDAGKWKLSGKALWYSEILSRETSEEWKTIDKLTLASRQVY